MASDRLADAVLRLPAPWQGHYFAAVDSTQDEARAAARGGAPTRTIFVADFQRSGRGRAQRQWLASPGTGLLMSLLFREPSSADTIRPWRYTSLLSLALIQTLDCLRPAVAPAIKWPNDVVLHDRKVAGVLAETSWNGRELQVIVGAGVNVTAAPGEVLDATCLETATGRRLDRGDLLLTFVSQLDVLLEQSEDAVYASWQSRLWRRGQRLRLLDGGREEEVVILGADRDGTLRVRAIDGSQRITTTGELLA
jgi:BirA family biotin operon repressor/biotin-[acetyl-CoA-carboxylase] ligase